MHIKQTFRTLATNAVRILSLATILASTIAITGCRSFGDGIRYNGFCDRILSEKIATFEAKRAWGSYRSRCGGDCLSDVKRGFIAGYKSCAMGSDVRSPIMPDRRYWSTWYQSSYGQQKIDAWYKGYPLGVAAARVKGHGYHLRTPVTEEVSAYLAATSPTAMQEARRASERAAGSDSQPQPVQSVQPQAPTQGSGTRNSFTQPTPSPANSYQADRQPAVREYLDLPSDTTELSAPNFDDPFIGTTSKAANQFNEEAASAAADFGRSIDNGSQKVKQFAGDFPAALLPGHN